MHWTLHAFIPQYLHEFTWVFDIQWVYAALAFFSDDPSRVNVENNSIWYNHKQSKYAHTARTSVSLSNQLDFRKWFSKLDFPDFEIKIVHTPNAINYIKTEISIFYGLTDQHTEKKLTFSKMRVIWWDRSIRDNLWRNNLILDNFVI